MPKLTERENEISDDTIKKYILNILKDDTDDPIEKQVVLEILQKLNSKN
ncbi:MAG: hypothetical protein GTO44_10050 [Hydrotalea flava]|nr:hypothetical protein [Hydrotalea flava]NIN15395.1 hypothetical protein [Hydrotalea flava]